MSILANWAGKNFQEEEKKISEKYKNDLSQSLITNDGTNYGKITRKGLKAIQNNSLSNYTPANKEEENTINSFKNSLITLKGSDGKEYSIKYGDYEFFSNAMSGKLGDDWLPTSYGVGDARKGQINGYYNKVTKQRYEFDIDSISKLGYMSPESVQVLNDYNTNESRIAFIKNNNLQGFEEKYGIDIYEFGEKEWRKLAEKHGWREIEHSGGDGESFVSFECPENIGAKNPHNVKLSQTTKDIIKLKTLAENNDRRDSSTKDYGALYAAGIGLGNGITFGIGDYLADKTAEKKYKNSGLDSDYYISHSDAMATTLNNHKIAYGAGSIGGTIATSLGLGGLVKGGLKVAGVTIGKKWAEAAVIQGTVGAIRGGVTTATSGGDWKDIGIATLREGLTGAVSGAAGAKIEGAISNVLTNPKYANTVLNGIKDMRLTAYGAQAISGLGEAIVDWKTDREFVRLSNNLFGTDLEQRTGTDLLTDFAVTMVFGFGNKLNTDGSVDLSNKVKDFDVYINDYDTYKTLMKSDADVNAKIKAGEDLIARGNELKQFVDEKIFTGQKDTVDLIKNGVDTVNEVVKTNNESFKKVEVKTTPTTETGVAPTKNPTNITPVSTEGGVIKNVTKPDDNIIDSKTPDLDVEGKTPLERSNQNIILEKYSDREIENWKNSNKIVVFKNNEQFYKFVDDSLKNIEPQKKMYFGKITKDAADRVYSETGIDVNGLNIALKGYEIRKILLNSHGNKIKENLRGQIPITKSDLLNIPDIITKADDITLTDKLYEGKPAIKFIKNIDGKNYVLTYVSKKHHDLAIQTMYKTKNKSLATAENANAQSFTSETTNGTALINDNIPQNVDTVNNKYIPKRGEVFTDENGMEFTRVDDIDDSFGVRIFEGKTEHGNDSLKIDIDNPDIDGVVNSAEYKMFIENSFEIKETKGVTLTAERAFERSFGKNYGDFRKVVYDNLDKSKLQYMNVLDFLTKGLEENVINRGITKGSKDSSLLQMYGEGEITLNELKAQTPNWQNIVEADRYIRKMYDSLIDSINDTKKKIYPNIEEQELKLKNELEDTNHKLDLIEQGNLDGLSKSKGNKVLRAQELEKTIKAIDANSKMTINALDNQISEVKDTLSKKKNKETKVYAELDNRLVRLEAKKERLKKYYELSHSKKVEQLNNLLGEYENSGDLTVGISKKAKDDLLAKRKRIVEELNDEIRWRGKRIPKRKDYYRHFQELSNSILGELLNRKNSNISAELVLVSEHTRPKSKWESFAQRRKGETTKYDAVAGYLDYIDAAAYAMTIDPNISIIRKLTEDITHETSSSNPNTHGTNNANATIQRLNALANELSGKTVSQVDRVVQDTIGRKNFRIARNVVNKIKGSAILYNIGSAVMQIGNLPNAVGTLKHKSSLVSALSDSWLEVKPGKNNLYDAIMNRTEIQNKSPFLKERYFDNVKSKFDTGVIANVQKLGNWMLTVGDEMSTRLTWNAFYREAEKLGVENPIQYADSKTRKCVGGRGLGEKSLAQQSATLTAAVPFSLEVSNAWQVQKDIYKDLFNGVKQGDVKSAMSGVRDLLSLYVANAVLSVVLEKIRGSDGGVFNPIGILIKNFVGDDNQENPLLKSAQEITGNFVGSLPLGQTVAGYLDEETRKEFFGSEDPMRYGDSSLLKDSIERITDFRRNPNVNTAVNAVSSFIPGGAQLRKTAGAYDVLETGGVYNNRGNLKYPVEKDASNYVKGMLFGKSALKETRSFYDNNRTALTENETNEYNHRVERGENPQSVYDDIYGQKEERSRLKKESETYYNKVDSLVNPVSEDVVYNIDEIYNSYSVEYAERHDGEKPSTISVPEATKEFKRNSKTYILTEEQCAELQNKYNKLYEDRVEKILNNKNLTAKQKYNQIMEKRKVIKNTAESQFFTKYAGKLQKK